MQKGPINLADGIELPHTFSLRIKPSAACTECIDRLADGSYKIAVAAPPEDGEANTELIRYLAEMFGVPRSHVEILAGAGARRKLVRIER